MRHVSLFEGIINKKKKEWNAPGMMDGARAERGDKIPFSSPLINYSTYGGIPRDRITELFGEPGGGKAQPLYSKVLTPTGFVNMGDIKVGDTVFDGVGNLCKVTGVYPQGKRAIYEITTQANNKIRVADNHLNSVWWYNEIKHEREDFVWTTEELIEKFNQYGRWRRIRFDIPSVDWTYTPVPIDPYIIGALLGDGCLSSGNFEFSNPEDDLVAKMNVLLNQYDYELVNYSGDRTGWFMRSIPDRRRGNSKTYFRKALEDLGMLEKSCDKRIPAVYLYNCKEIRTRLLQGYFDTDGCINKDGSVELTTTSPQLSEDFAFLVRSLGIRDRVSLGKGSYVNNGVRIQCLPTFTHNLKIENGFPFYSSNKHTRRYKDRQRPPLRNITKIEYVGMEECQCIMVDSPNHTYISDDFIPTHNTTTCIDICKNAYQIFKQEYDDKVNDLKVRVSKGDKAASVELEDLAEAGPKRVFYLDLEHSFDGAWSKTLGIKEDEISIMQPPDVVAEDILQTVQELIETGEVGLVVIDSLPSLIPRAELEKKYGERTVASLAGLLTVFCRKIVPMLTRYHTTMVFINQIRDNMDNPYVVKTPGGQAPKFYASLRINFRLGHPVDFLGNELPVNTENPAGYIVQSKIVKQKSAPNDRKSGSYFLMCQQGIVPMFDYAQLAVKSYGLIRKSGGWFTMCDPKTGEVLEQDGKIVKINGMAKVYQYLQENPEYYKSLQEYILNDINGKSPEEVEEQTTDYGV